MIINSKTQFIPENPKPDKEYQRRKRLVEFAVIITSVFAIFYVGVSWVAGFPMGMKIMTLCFIGDLVALLILRFGVNAYVVANFFGVIGSLCIFGCTWFSGGVYSPVFPWLVETPIVLLLIAGKKNGYTWVVISLAMAIAFGVLSYSGFSFPLDYNKSSNTFFFLTCNTGLVLIIFLISLIFENFRIAAFNEVMRQKDELQSTLSELKIRQTQLIQSEKMASLGELTAGIAHEIQNPLNFVNNFSELNTELISELKAEMDDGNSIDALSIANDISENEKKINHHGKRADAIVKGMLQHSQVSSGQKEPTDINALAEEYLRLSYHGYKAKENSFNVLLKTDFDNSIGKINIEPQEIGRVIKNLVTNAFYAVAEKKRNGQIVDEEISDNAQNGYQPSVTLKTSILSSSPGQMRTCLISVIDNGNGISQKVLDKIFQPFFTTKPTGEGTGLGLSLSYDIVKAHGGELKVETKEGEGSEFIIKIPFS
jgi:signal transduction histidine kinase